MLGESVRSFRSESEMGKPSKQINSPILTGSYQQLIENRLSSSGIFSQDLRHGRLSRRSRKTCKIEKNEPENFEGRNIFRSMFNDIEWTQKGNSEQCISKAETVENYAKRFPQGHWTLLGPGDEKKWCGILCYTLEGEWDSTATPMVERFKETNHPVLKSISALSRGILRRKNIRDTLHFNADASDTEFLFRTIHSATQLSIYGAVWSWCEEFGLKPNARETWLQKDLRRKKMSKCWKEVKPQEVNSLVRTARSDDPVSGHRLRERIQTFETLWKEIKFTWVCEDASFLKRVSIGMYYKTCCRRRWWFWRWNSSMQRVFTPSC